jgi:hypothetical protein
MRFEEKTVGETLKVRPAVKYQNDITASLLQYPNIVSKG